MMFLGRIFGLFRVRIMNEFFSAAPVLQNFPF